MSTITVELPAWDRSSNPGRTKFGSRKHGKVMLFHRGGVVIETLRDENKGQGVWWAVGNSRDCRRALSIPVWIWWWELGIKVDWTGGGKVEGRRWGKTGGIQEWYYSRVILTRGGRRNSGVGYSPRKHLQGLMGRRYRDLQSGIWI